MNEYVLWVLAAVSFYATWINADKRWQCWALWMATNTVWAVHWVIVGECPAAVLQVAYFGLSVRGLWLWRGRRRARADLPRLTDVAGLYGVSPGRWYSYGLKNRGRIDNRSMICEVRQATTSLQTIFFPFLYPGGAIETLLNRQYPPWETRASNSAAASLLPELLLVIEHLGHAGFDMSDAFDGEIGRASCRERV